LGVAATGGGFMIDVTDGWAARKSKTANDIGAAYDASLDKVKLAYALSKMYQDDLVPKPLLAAVALQNGFNAALTVADRAINKPPVLEVDRLGKRAMFFTQWGLGIHVIGTSLERNGKPAGRYVKMGGTALAGAGLALGVAASNKYHRTFMVSRTTSRMVPRSQTNHE
jgi:phosphatidylglycerophosphate synthase